MATTDGHQQVASNASSVGAEGDFDDEVPADEIDYDAAPICGCIPHLWSGSCGIVDYHVNPVVMIGSMLIIWTFVLWCGIDEKAPDTMATVNAFANYYIGWLYVGSLLVFGAFAVFLVFSRFGDIKLGKPGKKPKYSFMTWFSMLFSAGIGMVRFCLPSVQHRASYELHCPSHTGYVFLRCQ